MSDAVPKAWPIEARNLYKPIKPLGKGGFGTVWLAEPKSSNEAIKDSGEYVAIKLVGHAANQPTSKFKKRSESGYFYREVEVLKEISHPRIVKLLRVIEENEEQKKDAPEASPFCMVLEFCRGSTLDKLLKHGGGLGIPMAREVSAQLIDAVSFLHGRAVIHRDIKPDNIVIAGAKCEDEICWSEGNDAEEAAKAHKWNIKLIDFGFVRPLNPDEVKEEVYTHDVKPEPDSSFFGRGTIDGVLEDKQDMLSISKSISRKHISDLSAVGNRNYAAPEMLKGVRKYHKDIMSDLSSSGSSKNKKNLPLAECVADYGMNADAYSVGCTIRFLLTGVPPDVSINDFMAEKNSPLNILARKLRKTKKKKYRYTKDLPPEASRLVLGLTHWNERSRTTVRSARNYDWIAASYSMKSVEDHDNSSASDHRGEIKYLNCALERVV